MLPRMRRNLRRPTLALLLVTPAVVGCVNAPSDRVAAPPTGDTATWEVDPERRPTRDAQRVEVLVTRLGCASGKTGEVLPPDVREEDDQVVVTFAVERLARRDQTCPGNAPVPGGVDLARPVPRWSRSASSTRSPPPADRGRPGPRPVLLRRRTARRRLPEPRNHSTARGVAPG